MKKFILLILIFSVGITLARHIDAKYAIESAETVILENGSYFNGKNFVAFREIILKDGRIATISDKVSDTKGRRIPATGKFVIPGLTDAHEHLGGCPGKPYVGVDPLFNASSNVNCGVTTVVDLFYTETAFKALREKAAKDPQHYATLLMSGPILTAPGGHGTEYGAPTRTMTTPAEATRITGEVIKGGVDVIKLVYEDADNKYIPSISIDVVKAIVTVAHEKHVKVFAHIDRAAQAVACAEAGVDVLAHIPVDSLTDAQLDKLKRSGVILIPTITVMESLMEGHSKEYMSDPLLWKTAHPDYMENFKKDALKSQATFEMLRRIYLSNDMGSNLKRCIAKGIPIVAGTDAGNFAVFYGYSLHNELQQYVAAGMAPADALCAGTQNISLIFPALKTGKIKEGYDADLVMLDADPLADIANTKKINTVFHKGVEAQMATAEPSQKVSPVVSSFDPAKLEMRPGSLPPSWNTFSDQAMGGASEIRAELPGDATGTAYLHLTGKIVQKGYISFAGINILLVSSDYVTADLSPYAAIEFETRGNGETYRLSLSSSLITDYNNYGAPFQASENWQAIRIPFATMKQTPFGKQVTLDLKTIQAVNFIAAGKASDIDVSIRNIKMVK